ncbi:MAG: PAC2 family protein [Nanoarchaeota archaeon]
MNIILTKKPKNAVIIEGFPGFGLVGSIATEFLIQHLKAEKIGKVMSDEFMPITAVHDGNIIEPLSIYYSKKYNIVIVHALASMQGLEWKVAEMLIVLSKILQAKELISVEGIMSNSGTTNVFYYTDIESQKKKMNELKLLPLKEGIVMGVTGAIITKAPKKTCFFVESSMQVADSMAAAKIIETLDNYLGLKVDPKPLLTAAKQFEQKLKGIIEQSKKSTVIRDKKNLDYLG